MHEERKTQYSWASRHVVPRHSTLMEEKNSWSSKLIVSPLFFSPSESEDPHSRVTLPNPEKRSAWTFENTEVLRKTQISRPSFTFVTTIRSYLLCAILFLCNYPPLSNISTKKNHVYFFVSAHSLWRILYHRNLVLSKSVCFSVITLAFVVRLPAMSLGMGEKLLSPTVCHVWQSLAWGDWLGGRMTL